MADLQTLICNVSIPLLSPFLNIQLSSSYIKAGLEAQGAGNVLRGIVFIHKTKLLRPPHRINLPLLLGG
jgi:hypothetical protein